MCSSLKPVAHPAIPRANSRSQTDLKCRVKPQEEHTWRSIASDIEGTAPVLSFFNSTTGCVLMNFFGRAFASRGTARLLRELMIFHLGENATAIGAWKGRKRQTVDDHAVTALIDDEGCSERRASRFRHVHAEDVN